MNTSSTFSTRTTAGSSKWRRRTKTWASHTRSKKPSSATPSSRRRAGGRGRPAPDDGGDGDVDFVDHRLLLPSRHLDPDLERVVAVDHLEYLRLGIELRKQRTDLAGAAKLVAGSLHEQHRFLDRREVFVTPLLGSSGRVQRIAEKNQSIDPVRAL